MNDIVRKGDANTLHPSSREKVHRTCAIAASVRIFLEVVRKTMRNAGRNDDPDGLRAPYEMEADHAKLADIATCLIIHAGLRGATANRARMLDALFLADVAHLNDYGRPISYDHYDAIASGPVARTFDAMLSEDAGVLRRTGAIKWVRTIAGQKGADTFTPRDSPHGSGALTPSDSDALRTSMDKVIDCGDATAGATTRLHAAYTKAWRAHAKRQAFPMDVSLFFDPPDEEEARLLSWMSRGRL